MNRKSFLKKVGLGLSLAAIPTVAQKQIINKSKSKKSFMAPKIIKKDEGKTLNVIGDIQTHKIFGSDTNNQIVEWMNNVEPGVGIPPHIHSKEDEIFRVMKGKIEIMVDKKTFILNEGDIAFAPKNVPHAWKVVGTENAQMITSAFPAGIEKMFNDLSELPAGPPDFEKVSKICGNYGITFI